MAKNQVAERPQTQTEQERSLSRRDYYPFPSFGGELFSLSPFAFLREMTDWMDRSMAGTPSRTGGGRQTTVWAPAIEVSQKDNNLTVRADLPGIEPNDVKLEVDNDMLVIQGERKQEHTEERQGWHRSERVYGSFYRAIPLPEGAKTEQAKAEFRNGVLEVNVPIEEPKTNRRQIQIQGTSSTGTSSMSAASSGTPHGGSVQR
jgi:HSP20 family protein